MRNVLAILIVTVAIFGLGCKPEKEAATGSAPAKLRIAVIPKGSTHVHWRNVQKGAQKAADELGVEMIWKSALKESDRKQQIDIVNDFRADKVDAICLAPLDDQALVQPVQDATAAHIPVVIFDSGLKAELGKDYVSYVATDNHKGGALAGEQLVKLIGGKGKVVLLRYMIGSASTTQREEGFLEVIKKHPEIELLVDNQYAGATANDAQDKTLSMLDQLKKADGIFSCNESATVGMLQTLKQNGLTGKVKFVGFDASPILVDALRAGDIQALVAQDPLKMGYESVKVAVAAAKKQSVDPNIDTGVHVITQEDLEKPEIKKLLEQP